MIGTRPQRWDIYWYDLVYEDDPSKSKKRPILIINGKEIISLIKKITSKSRPGEVEYELLEWRKAGLDNPSTIRLGISYPANNNQLGSKIGTLQKVDIDNIKKIMANNNLKFESLDEKYGYHYGDLNVAKKADTRRIMMGRGTGGFGTGFYFLSKPIEGSYNSRDLWEIDLDSYNLYRPRSNNHGYEVHDALRDLNNLDINLLPYIGLSKWDLEKELDDLIYDYDDEGTLKFIEKYDPNYIMINKYVIEDAIKEDKWGIVEKACKQIINDIDKSNRDFKNIPFNLSLIFDLNKDKVKNLIIKILHTESEDSYSTLFMKALGYEGVDVTHLNKDADGLSGLDNFKYGSVIYDLKPGTYKKINKNEI